MAKEDNKKELTWEDPVSLITGLSSEEIDKENLSPHQRKVIVKYYLENESQTSNVFIARLIGVSDVHVSRIKRQLLEDSAFEIERLDVVRMAVSLKKKKEEYQRKASEDGNYNLAWKIELDYIQAMQELGFVYKAPTRLEVKTERADFRQRMMEFLDEYGVPTAEQFFGLLESVQGNGKGDGSKILEQSNKS